MTLFQRIVLCDHAVLLRVATGAMRKQIVETIMRERETAAQICEAFGNHEAASAIRCQPEPTFARRAILPGILRGVARATSKTTRAALMAYGACSGL